MCACAYECTHSSSLFCFIFPHRLTSILLGVNLLTGRNKVNSRSRTEPELTTQAAAAADSSSLDRGELMPPFFNIIIRLLVVHPPTHSCCFGAGRDVTLVSTGVAPICRRRHTVGLFLFSF